MELPGLPPKQGLYDPRHEKDSCGIGFVVNIKGQKSHDIVRQGLQVLENLAHRGAQGCDPCTGDGAGILLQVPHEFLRRAAGDAGVKLPGAGEYGVGQVFLPPSAAARQQCETLFGKIVEQEGTRLLGWRDVPVKSDTIGVQARKTEPFMRQVFVARDVLNEAQFERKLYVIRKLVEKAIRESAIDGREHFYIPSLSASTIVYKGLLLPHQMAAYYQDLKDASMTSALALVHSRFSTNTFPTWPLAHPYRHICHNGEINTLKGNVNWMKARQGRLHSELFGKDMEKLFPIVYEHQSDSACLDNALEFLLLGGRSLPHAMMMLIPEPWVANPQMDLDRRGFYQYHAAMMEPWDGPAAVCFTDGKMIGATLDRNGLRPCRYQVTTDGTVVLASEAGVLPADAKDIRMKGRLQPGRMFLVDTVQGRIIDDEEIKADIVGRKPYRSWVTQYGVSLDELPEPLNVPQPDHPTIRQRQQAFGYTVEELKMVITPMIVTGEEAISSMGTDTPLAVLSDRPQLLFKYFKQLFAQVTNPPIDPIREQLVMSLVSFVGPKPNLLDINNINPPMRLEVSQPVLDFKDMAKIRSIETYSSHKFRSFELDVCYPLAWGKEGVEARLASLCAQAVDAVKAGYNILIVTDRSLDAERVAIPALLATSAIHQQLIVQGLRTSTGLVVETGSAREVHHFALLAGYGAEAVHPYLALESLSALHVADADKAPKNYIKAIGKGLNKVMSKMGISTYMSYCGAQIFEAVGLNRELVDKYFRGTASNIGGVGLFEIMEEAVRAHRAAFSDDPVLAEMLDSGGEYQWRVRGEEHMWTPDAIAKLQHSTRANSYQTYKEYAQLINDQSRRHMTLRGLFEFKLDPKKAIALDEVEPAKDIVKRFSTGAMSLGSISTEAHSTLAIAMNRIGGKSNTGEGGEDERRYQQELRGIPVRTGDTLASVLGADRVAAVIPLQDGDSLRSRIKQ
ncbi:MAG TPA: glutamate synthase central domain-containing protein, partial [Nitrospira sp.]|nr:glutamate synthase central domain-containing protein [Nitrospira sp.]